MRALILLAALLIGLVAPNFTSPAVAATDATTAQTIIRSQMEALVRDDAAAAYSYASPEIHSKFREAGVFLSMVQRAYPPIYRHKIFEFGESRISDGKIAQRVHIVDSDGDAWEALYTLEAQPDGSLKIVGCVLVKAGQEV